MQQHSRQPQRPEPEPAGSGQAWWCVQPGFSPASAVGYPEGEGLGGRYTLLASRGTIAQVASIV